jgi:phosphatidate cytidylyltransferase
LKLPNLVQRVALAAVGIPIVYICLRQGGLILLIAVDGILFFCLFEFLTLIRKKQLHPNRLLTILGGLAISWDAHFFNGAHVVFILFVTLMCALMAGLRRDRSTFLHDASLTLFGLLFIGFGISSLLLIRHLPAGADYTILVILLVWICDTVAYFIGISLGRHPLWPQVSPKKTIEGSIAGLLGAWAAALAAKFIFLPEITLLDGLALGAIAGVLGQAGDLVESAFKRFVEVKDSSHLLPGHGGFLDRFDSLFLTVPSVYYYVRFVLQ